MQSQASVHQFSSPHLLTLDAARKEAERAATFQLESLVTTVIRSCRADLSSSDRLRLCHGALKAHRRGLALARRPSVSQCFQIDVNVLRDRSIGIARFRMRKDFTAARELIIAAISAAIVPSYPVTKHAPTAIFPRRHSALSQSAPLAA